MALLDLAHEKQEKYNKHFNKYVRPLVEEYVKTTGSTFELDIGGNIKLEFDGEWWIVNTEPTYHPIVCNDLEKDIQNFNLISRLFCKYEHDVYQYIAQKEREL